MTAAGLGVLDALEARSEANATQGAVLHRGAARSEVIKALGPPWRSRLAKGGVRIDVYPIGKEAQEARERAQPKAHGLMEILTFGLWQAVEGPLEQALHGSGKRLIIEYGPDNRVRAFRTAPDDGEPKR
jgi:hypothetical protein